MKKLFLLSALAASALPGVAHAENTGPYVTIEGGVVRPQGARVTSVAGFEHTDRFKTGWEAGAALGYDFGHMRLEAEGFTNRSVLRSQVRPFGTPLPNGTFTQSDGLSGRTTTYAGMGNLLVGLGHWGGVKVYAGGGAGYARVRLNESLPTTSQIRSHDAGFAWQALAGLTLPVSHNIDLGVKYRYFRPDGADHFSYQGDGTARYAKLRSHSLLATLTVNFGASAPPSEPAPAPAPMAPPPPAPPPPPPPPAPVAAVCNHGPFITFFDWDKADITPEAASILDSAVQAYGNCASVGIALAGYTDSSGTPKYNIGLATRRDAAVEAYLTSHGIAAGTISSHAFGEANQRVPTADGVRELQNRRVEITYGPGSGS